MSTIESTPSENLDFDQRVGRNIMKFRGDKSQQALAERMRDKGFKWSQATVWATEKGDRPIRLSEVIVLSEILKKPYDAFFLKEHDANSTYFIAEIYQEILRARSTFDEALKSWITAKRALFAVVEEYSIPVEQLPEHTGKYLKNLLDELDSIARPEHVMDMYKEAEAEVEAESDQSLNVNDLFDESSD